MFSDKDLRDNTTIDDQTKFGFKIENRIRFGLLTSHTGQNGTIGELQAGVGLGNDRNRAGVTTYNNGSVKEKYKEVYYFAG